MAKKNGKRDDRKDREFRRRARRDVRVAYKPEFQALRRERRRAGRESRQYQGQVANLYEDLTGRLEGLGPSYTSQVQGISEGLQGSLGQLVGMLGGTPEAGAAAGLFGAVGEGGLATLAGQAARGVGYNTSALRQAAIDATNYQTAILEDLQQYRQALAEQRHDLAAQMRPMILARIDELRDRAEQLALARKEFQLRKLATMKGLDLQDQASAGWTVFLDNLLGNQGGSRNRPATAPAPTIGTVTPGGWKVGGPI